MVFTRSVALTACETDADAWKLAQDSSAKSGVLTFVSVPQGDEIDSPAFELAEEAVGGRQAAKPSDVVSTVVETSIGSLAGIDSRQRIPA